MIFVMDANDVDIKILLIFPNSLKFNMEVFINYLAKVVLTWIDCVATGRPYFWRQDSAPCRTRVRTQYGCQKISATSLT